jgi:hypothetical protein
MAKIYCSACGQSSSFTDLKPKFCGNCSKPFTQINLPSTASIPKTFKSKPKPTPVEQEYEEEEEEHPKLDSADIPKLEFETLGNLRNRVSLKSLGQDTTPKQEIIREKPKKKKSFKEFEQEWADDMKSARGKKTDLDE